MTATTPDYEEIVRVVQLYVDGCNDRDVNKFKEAFHEDAWIFFTDAEGVLHKVLSPTRSRRGPLHPGPTSWEDSFP